MDALIFVAVAVAWAVYLIPKAIRHHDEAARSRPVDRFSQRLRVVARREAVSRRKSTLVVPSQRPAAAPADEAPAEGPSPAQVRARRAAARKAARRRRRVLLLLLTSVAAVAGVAAYGLIQWWYVAIPAGLLLAWLITCRITVKTERRSWQQLSATKRPAGASGGAAAGADDVDPDAVTETIETAGLAAALRDPALWDPVPVTLPTYVTKPTAERTVRTIDLETSAEVWTSGNTAADSALARQADEAARAAREAEGEQRAMGSAG